MTAIYRMSVEGWDVQRAYAEMRQYGFYKRWGHGPLKAYVFDYYRQLQQGGSSWEPLSVWVPLESVKYLLSLVEATDNS